MRNLLLQYAKQTLDLKVEKDITDKELDNMVCQLCVLTDDEINILDSAN